MPASENETPFLHDSKGFINRHPEFSENGESIDDESLMKCNEKPKKLLTIGNVAIIDYEKEDEEKFLETEL